MLESARIWRAVRFRGLWSSTIGAPSAERVLVESYSTQLARLGGSTRGSQPEYAVEALDRAVRLPQAGADLVVRRYALAQLLLGGNRLDEAQFQLQKLVDEAPGYWRGWVLLANVEYAKGDRLAAVRHLEQALKDMPAGEDPAERLRLTRLLDRLTGGS